jgi:ABC-type Mn2+/Zn2+ transport system permease subunit
MLSYWLDLASGATIIVTGVLFFSLVMAIKKLVSLKRLPSDKM